MLHEDPNQEHFFHTVQRRKRPRDTHQLQQGGGQDQGRGSQPLAIGAGGTNPGPGGRARKWHVLSPVGVVSGMGEKSSLCPLGLYGLLLQDSPPELLRIQVKSQRWAQSRQKRTKKQFGGAPLQAVPLFISTYVVNISSTFRMSLALLQYMGCSDGKKNPVRPVGPQRSCLIQGQGQGIKNKVTKNNNLCSAENSNKVMANGVRGHRQR